MKTGFLVYSNGDDDYEIDERTGDFKIFSEVYGYERKHTSQSQLDLDDDDEDSDDDDDF